MLYLISVYSEWLPKQNIHLVETYVIKSSLSSSGNLWQFLLDHPTIFSYCFNCFYMLYPHITRGSIQSRIDSSLRADWLNSCSFAYMVLGRVRNLCPKRFEIHEKSSSWWSSGAGKMRASAEKMVMRLTERWGIGEQLEQRSRGKYRVKRWTCPRAAIVMVCFTWIILFKISA